MKYFNKVAITLLIAFPLLAQADDVKVAVAANFQKPLEEISKAFEADTGHKLIISAGATGQLYTQIKNGAPFDLFMSADSKTPKKLVDEQIGVAGTSFTYATGQLALWSADGELIDSNGAILKKNAFHHLALANPKTAPYGAAAVEVLKKMGVEASLTGKIVEGESIAQAKQFVDSGNAELGFVALSQISKDGKIVKGSAWIVPSSYYQPILQDAVLLKPAANNQAVKSFLEFLKGKKATAIIASYGYKI